MSLEKILQTRSATACELCKSSDDLNIYSVQPNIQDSENENIYICATCNEQITGAAPLDGNHWRCLNESMWSEVPAAQVVAWRMLSKLNNEAWAQELLDMLYLDDATLSWAQSLGDDELEVNVIHKDSNGATLQTGDTVTLTKDLNVKGANFTAKRGTAVRNINLVADNELHIEGKINGQKIVILTQYVKKSN